MADPVISVVVIGRNEGPRLRRCLESIRNVCSLDGQLETIYVDSASEDGSLECASSLGCSVIALSGGCPSAGRARNAGWQAATAPFILFLDGDTILHPEFPFRALREFENPRVMVVTGNRREISPEASKYNRVLDLDWLHKPGFVDYCGGDALIRRTALEQTGGFDANLIAGEEPDLCWRIRNAGGLVLHIDAPMTGHDLAMLNWRQYWRRATRTGHAYAEVSGLYSRTSDPLWRDDSRRNCVRGSLYLFAPVAALSAAVVERSWVPIALLITGISMLFLRSAFKARSRRLPGKTLILFAIHSHIQHLPIFLGQAAYWLRARQGRVAAIIEYKNG
jgi:glycosyltransferase involved in cell wall biosynthesis